MAIPAEIRFKRYLCYTNEANIYYPGCRFFHGRYKPENVPSLEELIKENKQDYIFNTIKSMYEEKKTCYPDTLLFVLSRLIRVKEFRPQALELAELICVKSEPFFVFMKFCLEISPKMGFGRKFRKFVRNWYNKKEYLQLAEIVGKMKNYRGWNHGDLMKLSHVKVNDPAKACSVKYAVQGLEAMKKEFGDVPESKKVVEYLSTIEEYRTKTDAAEVAAKIDSYMLELGHINHVLHGDKLIWKSLLAQMPVAQVLQYFQHMSRKKMFRTTRNWDFIFVDTVIEALTKPFANRENVTVSKVFIEMMNYENAGRVKQELATKLKTTPKKPPILNADISNAFITLMDTVFKELKPTGKKIMIAIELSNEMLKRRCAVSRYVGLYEAAMFIAYYFRRLEENVKVFTFNPTAMKPLTINKEGTVKNAIEVYKNEDVPEVTDAAQKSKGDELITTWIKETGSKSGGADEVDVCIILKSYLDNNSLHTLVSSGAASKKLKFIVSDLCGIPKNSKPPDKRNLFVTSGFDEKLIEALAFFVSDVI